MRWCERKEKAVKELSLNILDVAKNSVKAGATRIVIRIDESDGWRTLSIIDNGCGMPPEFVATVTDPFTTTRTTRPVGMGLPLLKLADLMTDGNVLYAARDEAQRILAEDPPLALPKNRLLKEKVSALFADIS